MLEIDDQAIAAADECGLIAVSQGSGRHALTGGSNANPRCASHSDRGSNLTKV